MDYHISLSERDLWQFEYNSAAAAPAVLDAGVIWSPTFCCTDK